MSQRIQFSFVGFTNRPADVRVEMDVVPRVGEIVHFPGLSEADTYVRTIVWYPLGDPDEGRDEPFVYVVIGPPRKDAPEPTPQRDR